ncbi:hypothetical protein EVAR_81276_1 [Eumeta japonica]|uniref:Uncharacterized protein n=1 Tax=Eumeta variegata TaxID=151549 RepID=A0A4C1WRV0_EUMVA|nr:hypothetical protein EVAR_81276_1 [Eumeta japonica]
MKAEKDFIKTDSANLPKVDSFMIANFFASNPDFCSAEFRNVKTSVSSRQPYGDDAIGYVQLKRDHTLCTVKCTMCPEHKVRQTSYSVSMVIDEKEGVVNLTNEGFLHRITGSAIPEKFWDKIKVSNGLTWDLVEKAFNYIDSLEYAIRG